MGGMVSNMSQKIGSAAPSGGKSSPASQNAYGSSYQAPAAHVYQPSYSAPQQNMGSGKSSGLGQGGYGQAPAFQQPQGSMQPMGTASRFNPFTTERMAAVRQDPTFAASGGGYDSQMRPVDGLGNLIAQNNSGQGFGQAIQGLGMIGGGKSSGAGQGGYGQAPGFDGVMQVQGGGREYWNARGGPNPYQQQFGGFQQQPQFQQQQFNPFQQQQFNPYQQQQPQGIAGLQSLFNNMMGQQRMQQQMQQQPIQRQPMQQYQSQALQFRPNMQNAQSALSRVRPSVQRQGQDAQAARIAELEAQIAAQQQQYYYNPYGSDAGGG